MRLAPLVAGLCLASAAAAQDSARTPRSPRRRPVTAEDERTAFVDPRARELFARARIARLRQDSALRSYDAKSYFRVSVGMGFRRIGPQRLLFRSEQAARVQWSREAGTWIEPTGRRTGFPMGHADVDLAYATPIPYFPGRESLWLPSSQGVAKVEVDEDDIIHPLATGAEAYYRYATGDSLTFRLPDGKVIGLRELRITARRPQWRSIVGSFWFDVASGGLVRAAYRTSAEIDIWAEAKEDQQRIVAELEEKARTDTGKVAQELRKRAKEAKDEEGELWIGKAILSPARAKISSVTVEYGLYEGRFWLPKLNVAEAEFVVTFARVPLKWEESFRYQSVNGDESIPPLPAAGAGDSAWSTGGGSVTMNIGGGSGQRKTPARDTSTAARRARQDSAIARWLAYADTARIRKDSAKTAGDTAREGEQRRLEDHFRALARQITRRRESCGTGTPDTSFYSGTITRYDGALRIGVRMPCDTVKLAQSPDLPGSIYDSGEELFGAGDRDALLDELGFSLQPGWGPQPPAFHSGLDLLRYNRIEGLSAGATLTSQLGLGYSARLLARLGVADVVPNGELSLQRSNGRSDIRVVGFHRFAVANDDWGAPLSFGASLANLIDGGDEGFYYRAYGAELAGTRDAPGPLGGFAMSWRMFAERHRSAGIAPNTQASLGHLIGDVRFTENIDATQLSAAGASADLARSVGANPRGLRLDTRMRAEGAVMDAPATFAEPWYARGMLEVVLVRPLTSLLSGSLSAAGGYSAGTLPLQRAFFVGGLHTVRGQSALPSGEGRVGDAFWLGRAELGFRSPAVRPSVFYDAGWAGSRDAMADITRPLSGWGIGVSMIDGLFRFDASRGLWPETQWRFDVYIGARF